MRRVHPRRDRRRKAPEPPVARRTRREGPPQAIDRRHVARDRLVGPRRRGGRMSTRSFGNMLVLQGGGPTPVFNASLFGVIDEARQRRAFGRLFGARSGWAGLLKDDVIDLTDVA